MSDWVLQTSRGIWYQEELLSELKILDSNDLVSNMQENKPGQTPQKFEVNGKAKKNIARGTTDYLTWVISPAKKNATWIGSKFGHEVAPLASVTNLATRLRHLH